MICTECVPLAISRFSRFEIYNFTIYGQFCTGLVKHDHGNKGNQHSYVTWLRLCVDSKAGNTASAYHPTKKNWRCQRSQLKKTCWNLAPPLLAHIFQNFRHPPFLRNPGSRNNRGECCFGTPVFLQRKKHQVGWTPSKPPNLGVKNLTKLCGTTDLKHGHAWKKPQGPFLNIHVFFSRHPKSEFKLCATMWRAWIVISLFIRLYYQY